MSFVGGIFAMGLPATIAGTIRRSRRDDFAGSLLQKRFIFERQVKGKVVHGLPPHSWDPLIASLLETNAPWLSNMKIDGGGVYSQIIVGSLS